MTKPTQAQIDAADKCWYEIEGKSKNVQVKIIARFLTAAAEVGDDKAETDAAFAKLNTHVEKVIAATIERCIEKIDNLRIREAQKADWGNWGKVNILDEAIAAIRALKDHP